MNPNTNIPESGSIKAWKICYYGTLGILPLLIVLNFYGLYSNQFYFLKIDNYIFPLVSVLHVVFLHAIRFRIHEQEYPDTVMRNVEYGMYAVLMIYIFKCFDTLYILMSYDDFSAYLIPDTFLPVGVLILILQIFLVMLTVYSFRQRRSLLGSYDFDQIDKNMNSWQ
ncbi:MAG: hypothetical protein P8X60_01615 [Robiginitalea sp.]